MKKFGRHPSIWKKVQLAFRDCHFFFFNILSNSKSSFFEVENSYYISMSQELLYVLPHLTTLQSKYYSHFYAVENRV